MVVAVYKESMARAMAQTQNHCSTHDVSDVEGLHGYGDEGASLWSDPIKSSCVEIGLVNLKSIPEPCIVITDYIYA